MKKGANSKFGNKNLMKKETILTSVIASMSCHCHASIYKVEKYFENLMLGMNKPSDWDENGPGETDWLRG